MNEIVLSRLREVEALAVRQVQAYYSEIDPSAYTIHFANYGMDAVLGECEPTPEPGHEVGVMFEVLAPTQEQPTRIMSRRKQTGSRSILFIMGTPFVHMDAAKG